MERVVNHSDGTTWTCIQAFTGLSDHTENREAGQVKGKEDTYWVVCTPSGGAQSVRLQLPEDWETACSDNALLQAIEAQSGKGD